MSKEIEVWAGGRSAFSCTVRVKSIEVKEAEAEVERASERAQSVSLVDTGLAG